MEGGAYSIESLPPRVIRVHRMAKGLSQGTVFIGLICVALGALADYEASSGPSSSARLTGLPECIGLYLIVMGWVGICGTASYRRGMMAALLVMCLHAIIICVPALIIYSGAGIILSNKGCYYGCQNNGESCTIICGATAQQAITLNPE